MFELTLQFAVSAAAIVGAGVFLVRSTDTIANLTPLGRAFAGSILLAGATSLPELLVDVSAIRKGMPDLAVGDLMGSSLMNLMILAGADMVHRNPKKMFSPAGARHALAATISVNVTAVACIAIFLGPQLAPYAFGEIGLGTIAIGVIYALGLRLVFRETREPLAARPEKTASKRALASASSAYFISALVIFVASPYLAEAAGRIADRSGLGTTFVGTTLVALCTSLPELVSTIAAVRMGAFDLAVGNIFGSNAFNMILLVPLDFVHTGNLLGTVARHHVLTGLAVIVATSVALMGQLYQVEKRKRFLEPDAAAVIAIVLAALLGLYVLGPA